MLLVEVVHIVLQLITEAGELVIQVVQAHSLVLCMLVEVEAVDLLGPLIDVADEELDPFQGLIAGLANFLDLLFGQRVFSGLGEKRDTRQQDPNARDGHGSFHQQ